MGLSFRDILYGKKDKGPTAKEKFKGALGLAQQIAKRDKNDLHCLIKAFGKNIQYNRLAEFMKVAGTNGDYREDIRLRDLNDSYLWIDTFDETFNKKYLNEFHNLFGSVISDKRLNVSLVNDIVLPWPWRRQRIVDAIYSITFADEIKRRLKYIAPMVKYGPRSQFENPYQKHK